jgi:hypothetical protein
MSKEVTSSNVQSVVGHWPLVIGHWSLVIRFVVVLCVLPLTSGLACAATTRPSGYIVWSSSRGGEVNRIYRMNADGSGIVRLVDEESDYPRWSPDGRWISYVTPDATWVMHADGSGKKKLPVQIDWPEWAANGGALLGGQIDDQKRLLVRYDFDSGTTKTMVDFDVFPHLKGAWISKPALSPDGRWVFVMTTRFDGGYTATNGSFRPSGPWAAAGLDLQNSAAIYYVGDGCQPAVDPAGKMVYHSHGESGMIGGMEIGDAGRKSYRLMTKPDKDVVWAYCPAVSTDGRWITYIGANRHESWGVGDYDVYLQALDQPEAQRVRLATDPANDRWPHFYAGPLRLDAGAAPTTRVAQAQPPSTLPTTRSADAVVFTGEVLAVSKPLSRFNIQPYRECLILTKYRVIGKAEGKLAGDEVLVVHWGLKNLVPTPESQFKPGEKQRLVCEPFAAFKKLERYPMGNNIPDSIGRDWWLAVEWRAAD